MLLSHTSLTKTDILNSTIPFLLEILKNLPDEIKIKRNNGWCPLLGIGPSGTQPQQDKYKEAETAPTIGQIDAFVRGK
ncbi:MAG: hypothetical protein HPY66_1646 [Firmicutes bacterium]|nr:hypothetical protein [Bacillota bacterium]